MERCGIVYFNMMVMLTTYEALGSSNGQNVQSQVCVNPGIEHFYPKRDLYPFQPLEEIDFPTLEGNTSRIPHILHQIYNEKYIPTIYVPFIESFLQFNPSWQYRFWTYSSGRKLLQRHFPHLVETFDGLGNSVEKADMIRYLVLYVYGGVYTDLDVEFFKPLDRLTMKYAAVIPLEPLEHASLKYNASYSLINCILLSRPKHPFFKLILDGLQGVKPIKQPVITTGPTYITNKYKYYNHITDSNQNDMKLEFSSNSPYFFKGYGKEDDYDSVYIPNSQYLMNNIKENVLAVLDDMCFVGDISKLPYLKQRACAEFHRRKEVRENRKFTYMEHHWSCLWKKSKEFVINLGRIYIGDIVPNCTFYNDSESV